MAGACVASSTSGLLVIIDEATEDRSSQKSSEVYRDILSAQNQPNVAKVIGRFIVQMENNPKQQNQTQVF